MEYLEELKDDAYRYYLSRNDTNSSGSNRKMPGVAVLDALFQRYGWSYDVYMSQPQHLIEELMVVLNAESDADKVNNNRSAGRTGGAGAVPRDTPELMRQAREAGLPMPPPPGQVEAVDPLDGEMPQ